MKSLLLLALLVCSTAQGASFFKWKYRSFLKESDNGPFKSLVGSNKDLNQKHPLPSNTAPIKGADWSCLIQNESSVQGYNVNDSFLESRSIDCTHTSGATESQILTCSFNKTSKVNSPDSAEVNVGNGKSRLYIEVLCN